MAQGPSGFSLWQIFDQRVDWFSLNADDYVDLFPISHGIIQRKAFLGLWLDINVLLQGGMEDFLAILREGLLFVSS